MQVAVCDGIQVITPSMAEGTDYFADYPGFQQATVYKTTTDELILEIIYRQEGAFLKERKTVSQDELNRICDEVMAKMTAAVHDDNDADRDGRRKIIGATMGYSLLYYGWALPVSFDAKSSDSYSGAYLLIGASGYFIPMLATQNSTITKGMAKGYTYGCFLGITHGLALGTLINGGTNANSTLGISVLTSVAEGIGGLQYARNHQLSRAYMRTMGSMGTWGLAYGMGLPLLAESRDNAVYAGAALGMSALGVFAGDQLAAKLKPADGDVTVINGMGLIGAFLPLAIVNTFNGAEADEKAYVGGAILGSLAGLTLGFRKTSKMDYTRSEGNIVMLGIIAGGLIGSGTALLVGTEGPTGTWLVGAGMLGGFLLADRMTLKKKRKDNSMGASLSFDFNPVALQKVIKKESSRPQPGRPFLNGDLAKITLHL